MKTKTLQFGCIVGILLLTILATGCGPKDNLEKEKIAPENQENKIKEEAQPPTEEENKLPKPPVTVPTYTTETCAEQKGYVCSSGESCPGSTLSAVDTYSCCSVQCTTGSGSGTGITTYEPSPTQKQYGSMV